MRSKLDPRIKICRVHHPFGDDGGDFNAAYAILGPLKRRLKILVSDQLGWDHVSVSVVGLPDETPTWEEMCWVKDIFFDAEETAAQYHPPKSQYVNVHNGCLHLWRAQNAPMPRPPLIMV